MVSLLTLSLLCYLLILATYHHTPSSALPPRSTFSLRHLKAATAAVKHKHGSPLPSHINKAQLVLAKVREAHALVGKLFLYRHIIDTTRIRPGVDSYLRSPGNYQEPPGEPEYDSEDETEFDSAFSESS